MRSSHRKAVSGNGLRTAASCAHSVNRYRIRFDWKLMEHGAWKGARGKGKGREAFYPLPLTPYPLPLTPYPFFPFLSISSAVTAL